MEDLSLKQPILLVEDDKVEEYKIKMIDKELGITLVRKEVTT